ncbi:MAG: FecR domain-containing protein [Steroidobacteraceae bacterium]
MDRHGPDDLAALLKKAGPRLQADPDLREAVRAAAREAWREQLAQSQGRRNRRTFLSLAAAASAAAVALGLWWGSVGTAVDAELARVVRSDHAVRYLPAGAADWRPLPEGQGLGQGDAVRTGPESRVALALEDGVTLRLDVDSEWTLRDAGHSSLAAGAVYYDGGPVPGARDHVIETEHGSVRHLGTQYEARLLSDALRLAVREGSVALSTHDRTVEVEAGEWVEAGTQGARRGRVSPWDDQWAWIGGVTPPLDIEGRTLGDFLGWVARETGRPVVYLDPAARQRAEAILLRGSVVGLRPEQALDAVLATTDLAGSMETTVIRVGQGTP